VAQPTIPGIDQQAWMRQQQALSGTQTSQTEQSAQEALAAAETPEQLNQLLDSLGIRGT
jgi:hypothetical protein